MDEDFAELVDLEDIAFGEVTITTNLGQPVMDIIGASVGDLLEGIGRSMVYKYYGIPEEETENV